MIRSAVLTLGVIALGGVGAARAEGLSLFDWPTLSPLPAATGIFPRLPENWGDLPVRFHFQDSVGYNSNISNNQTTPGVTSALTRPIGAMESISTYGVDFKHEISGQQFFADAYWGMYRYLNNGRFNTAHHNEDIGDNFTYGNKCSGTVKASQATLPAQPGQQIGFNVINTLTTVSLNERARCIVNGEYSAIFNSGWSTSTNSALLDRVNNFQSTFVAAGISYTVSETNSFELLATLTGTDYTDHQSVAGTSGLVTELTTDQVMATYTKNLSPTFSLSSQVGVIGVSNSYFSLGVPHTILPEYSFNAQWSVTPKLSLTAAVSRLASPPTSIVSNLQVSESASAGFTYRWTPKIGFTGNLQAANITGAAGTVIVSPQLLNTLTSNQKVYSAGAKMTYSITPFLAADLSYQYYKTVQSNLTTTASVILLALNFNPY